MAKSTVTVSDLSGAVLENGNAAHVVISVDKEPSARFSLDVDVNEISELLAAAKKSKRRGRPKKTA